MTDINRELSVMIIWHGGDCVIQHRTHKPEGGYGFYGGKVKVGEAAVAAAIRETKEELGQEFMPEHVEKLGQLEADGWLVNVVQSALKFGTKLQSLEGEAIFISPREIIKMEKVMAGTLAATKEYILLQPDDSYRVVPEQEVVV